MYLDFPYWVGVSRKLSRIKYIKKTFSLKNRKKKKKINELERLLLSLISPQKPFSPR